MSAKSRENIRSEESKSLAELYDTMDFSLDYSAAIPSMLKELNISVCLTSYQAGRFITLRSDGESLDVNYKAFPRPMGLVVKDDMLTLGTFAQILNFHRDDRLIPQLKAPLSPIEKDITAPRLHKNVSVSPDDEPVTEVPVASAENESSETPNVQELKAETQEEQQLKLKEFREYKKGLMAPVDDRIDAAFCVRSSHYSGMINIHDIAWGTAGLWAVNSAFSCLCTFDAKHSFIPRWKPYFISELVPEDRCHLNGMAMKDGEPAYVSTFSQSDDTASWRNEFKGMACGTIMDVRSNKILVDDLIMPHSPRYHNGFVWFCESGQGTLRRLNIQSLEIETLCQLPGFTRGMCFYGDLLFVGLSRLRNNDREAKLPVEQITENSESGIIIFNTQSMEIIGKIIFTGNVDQIYDLAIIENCHFPEFIEPTNPRIRNHFSVPGYN